MVIDPWPGVRSGGQCPSQVDSEVSTDDLCHRRVIRKDPLLQKELEDNNGREGEGEGEREREGRRARTRTRTRARARETKRAKERALGISVLFQLY